MVGCGLVRYGGVWYGEVRTLRLKARQGQVRSGKVRLSR